MDPEEAAVSAASLLERRAGVPRFGFASLVQNPETYLEPVRGESYVHPSDIEGKGPTASRRGLDVLEQAGILEKNGYGYEVKVSWDENDYDAFIDELDRQKNHVL